MIRRYLPDYIAGIQALAKGSITDEENIKMAAGLKNAKPWVLFIWFIVFVEAVLGVVKPGNEFALQLTALF
ncbi:MAG: hypothetical protein HN673_14125 [Rhodospirillales bacterium]|nr:hypothetical protein [Rhodospirillales bacterium]